MTITSLPQVPVEHSEDRLQHGFDLARGALQVILSIALIGTTFSAVLTYRDYHTPNAEQCTPLGPSGSLFGYPPCVYGLVMYTLILLIAMAALVRSRRYLR